MRARTPRRPLSPTPTKGPGRSRPGSNASQICTFHKPALADRHKTKQVVLQTAFAELGGAAEIKTGPIGSATNLG